MTPLVRLSAVTLTLAVLLAIRALDRPEPQASQTQLHGLSDKTYEWGRDHVPIHLHREAAEIAAEFTSVAKQINSGEIASIDQAMDEIRLRLAPYRAGWMKWGKTCTDDFYRLYADGQITTPADFAVALTEVADGLLRLAEKQ
jgi:hypothetical protein